MTTLEIAAGDVRPGFGSRVFRVHHELTQHPLLQADALAELADFLPEHEVEHNRGDVPKLLPGADAARVDLSVGEIARSIETNGCWMVLKHIEAHPSYRSLLDDILDRIEPMLDGAERPMRERVGFVFLAAARAVTPAHIDPDYNLLLQIRGTKTIGIGTWDDVAHEQRTLERYYTGGHRNIDQLPARIEAVHLEPGDGVHVPIHAPHWVENGPSVSVSLSLTWRTDGVARAERVHACNSHLRRLGVLPRPPGDARLVDAAKSGAVAAWEATRGRLRRSQS